MSSYSRCGHRLLLIVDRVKAPDITCFITRVGSLPFSYLHHSTHSANTQPCPKASSRPAKKKKRETSRHRASCLKRLEPGGCGSCNLPIILILNVARLRVATFRATDSDVRCHFVVGVAITKVRKHGADGIDGLPHNEASRFPWSLAG
jgi:hypothetical protein